tara:strand:+ start:152 stop:553 length:402 start_codon:yes stop_codon:yes gene_type:complete
MFKIKQKAKKTLNSLFNLLIIIVIFLTFDSTLFGLTNNWVEVSKTPDGIQYLDRNSLNAKSESIIEITTKYSKLDPNTSEIIEDNIYVMRINCMTNKFKDISINGKNNSSAKWEAPNGDKLLDDVISESCKND